MSLYADICNPLNAIWGENVFQFWHTGGGCTAVQATLEGDITVMITDDPFTRHGEEAFITPMPERVTRGGDACFGYCIGIYGDEGSTELGQDLCSTVAQLPGRVASLIGEVVRADR